MSSKRRQGKEKRRNPVVKSSETEQALFFIGTKLNELVEFKNPELEKRFLESELRVYGIFAKWAILVFGLCFLLLSFFDYSYNSAANVYIPALIFRLVPFIGAIAIFLLNDKMSKKALLGAVSAYIALTFTCHLAIQYLHKTQGLTSQAMIVMAIIMLLYVLPNRWINSLWVSIYISASFLLVFPQYIKGVNRTEFIEVFAFLAFATFLTSAALHHSNYNKRIQFLKSKQLELISGTDSLTGINNRMKCDKTLKDWCAKKVPFAAVLFDLDHFKRINDLHGHQVGDTVLVEFVNIVKRGMRSTDHFARWGGEEFVILIRDAQPDDVVAFVDRIRKRIEEHSFTTVNRVTCSFGISWYREGDTPYTVIKRADECMYKAKEAGRNRVVVSNVV